MTLKISKEHLPFFIVASVVVISFLLMWNAAIGDTAIFDESAHIPAGYGYIHYLDYRLNPEHPPFVKVISAVPLLFFDLKFPVEHRSWTEDVNGQWEAGYQFLYQSGNDADQILKWSRFGSVILTLITIILIYVWSRGLLGKWWALLPAILFGLSPTVLAHGHYVTTDIGAAFGVLLVIFTFTKFLLKPTTANVIWVGLAFGIAQLMKFSNVLLIPYLVLLMIIFLIGAKLRKNLEVNWKRYFLNLIFVFIIGYAFVYGVYFLFTLNYPPGKQLADAATTLVSNPNQSLVDLNLAIIKNDVLRPLGQYFLGLLMTLQRATGGNTAYFFGELSANGWWYYFPLVFLIKEPLPSLILILAAIIFAFSKFKIKNLKFKIFANYLGTHFTEFAMLFFVVIYWAYSIQSALNIGVRHLLPTIPFIYILSTGAIKNWGHRTAGRMTVIILIIWYAGTAFWVSPYFLSYFNKLAGGANGGYRYVTDSNYDWGQDLKRLKAWVENPPTGGKIDKIAIDYFGGGDPKYYLPGVAEYWWSARGNPSADSEQAPKIEWLAVSVNTLQGAFSKLDSDLKRKPEDEYRWLKELRPMPVGLGQIPTPDFRAGTSIFIYKL
jgi:hypothetical protein